QIYRQPPVGAERPGAEIYGLEAAKAASVQAIVPALGDKLDYRPRTLVWNIARDEGRFKLDLMQDDAVTSVTVDRVILATGAVDRALPFPGWTLPGVFTLGAAQIALKSQGVAIGRRVALIGAGPLLPLIVTQYMAAGIKPVVALDMPPLAPQFTAWRGLLAEPTTAAKGALYLLKGRFGGVGIRSGIRAIRALGKTRVTGLVYTTADGREHNIDCDGIGASFGLRCEAQLADLAGCRFAFDQLTRQWQPVRDIAGRSSVAGIYLAGDGAAIGGADAAELAGERVAFAVLADIGGAIEEGRIRVLDRRLARQVRFRRALEAAYPFPGHMLDALTDDTIVCRCEGVTAGALRDTIKSRGPAEVNQMKAFTRNGMGRCQGRMCAHVGAELLARANGGDIVVAGRQRAQAPVKPLPLTAALNVKEPT
ncbi:MAG: NAD(P)/FAD-dependent oxidoreductase, partial [Hyphomicrobiaceae bacterium]